MSSINLGEITPEKTKLIMQRLFCETKAKRAMH
jgi:hypothetical protein